MPVDAAAISAATPPPFDFAALDIEPALVRALARQGITTPTPVQTAVLPDALAGHDILGRARTGSGKTLAFGIPVLTRLAGSRSRARSPRALIVVPTRELATQVRKAMEPLADAARLRLVTVYGGTPYDRQVRRLKDGADVVVATPGRLDDLIRRGACRLDDVEITVLDEADHLCDLGFYPAVDALLRLTPAGGQRLLLSATLDGDVDRLVRNHLHDPVRHEVDPVEGGDSSAAHHVLVVGPYDKREATTALLRANPRSIVFTRTREGATDLAQQLSDAGVNAVDLHGNLSQGARERNLRKFKTGQATVVVATDVAARGIHVDNVGMVVHYDLPDESKGYLHRSGRTARAGETGAVVTITTPRFVDSVVRLQHAAGVQARHHDARTTPQPMTVQSLAESGSPAPAPSGSRPPRSGAPRRSSAGYAGGKGRQSRYAGSRTGGGHRGRSSGGSAAGRRVGRDGAGRRQYAGGR
ncbi:MAG: DEAD/DEAH box helicase [Nocardioidaceae bacterium]